jgi:hypothetical protein
MLFYEPMQERQLVAFVQLVHFDSHTIILIRHFCLNSSFIFNFYIFIFIYSYIN